MSGLSAESLTCAYADERIVFRDLSITFRRGEVSVLLGANGAGKTTLLRTLAGQLPPRAGVVRLDNVPLSKLSRRDIAKRMALMPQTELQDTPLSVRDMVRLGRAAHRGWWLPLDPSDEQKVDEALAATGMAGLANEPILQLSGGQWRRAILARSLAQDASILLLDEPTSGLDLKHQYECLERIWQLVRSRNLIAVLSLHDLQQAALFADRIALLGEQRILAWGDCSSVLTAERIQAAYGIQVSVMPHPNHGRPLVLPAHVPNLKGSQTDTAGL